MNSKEMSVAFDIMYNNIRSNQAPGIEPYEKSVYLTRAQKLIEDELYSNFDKIEDIRKKSSSLLSKKTFNKSEGQDSSFLNSKKFDLPEDLRAIVYEQLDYAENASMCLRGKVSEVKPVTYDDLHNVINNPFVFTNLRALRLDDSNENDGRSSIIITKTNDNYQYTIQYIHIAPPIFVEGCVDGDLIDEVSYDHTKTYDCKLNKTLHQNLVEIAVKLASNDYKS